MKLDFTISQMQLSSGSLGQLEYEIELEISDIMYLQNNIANPELFHGIVRRFLQNTFSLTHLMYRCTRDIDLQIEHKKQEEIKEKEKIRIMAKVHATKFQEEAPRAFAKYYGMTAVPICGDYLHSVALARLN